MAFQRKEGGAIGVKAPFPGFIDPALATAIEKVPTGARWIHEIKFDGYRDQLHIANSDVKILTRRVTTGPSASRRWPTTFPHQRQLGDHRRRNHSAGGGRHHRLLGAAE